MLIRAIHLVVSVGIVISNFDVHPLNKAVLAGQRTELECKTNRNETISRWTAKRVGGRAETIFKKSDNQSITYSDDRFGQNGDSILYLSRTELNDSGVYTCYKNQDEVKRSAQLIVLESNPVCKSNISDGLKALSHCIELWIRCQVNFSTVGNWNPSMEWIQHRVGAKLIRNDSVTITTNTTVTSVLHVSISSIESGSYFSCVTFFKAYNGPVKTNASNIPDFSFIWNSTKIIFQENTLSTYNYFHVNISVSSEGKMANSVTTALIDGTGMDSSGSYWFSVSLSLVAVVLIFFVLIAIMALGFYIYRKRITAGVGDLFQESSLAKMDQPTSDDYDIIPFSYNEDGYDKIDDANDTDFAVPRKVSRRTGTLPTPGYDHLLGKRCSSSTYSPIGKCEQTLDKEDAKISPGHTPDREQHPEASKIFAVEQSVEVNAKCIDYVEIIS